MRIELNKGYDFNKDVSVIGCKLFKSLESGSVQINHIAAVELDFLERHNYSFDVLLSAIESCVNSCLNFEDKDKLMK